jgi:HAD superfamily hydrolase (TIGR01549 family)
MDLRIKRKWGRPYREELRELLNEKPELLDRAYELYQQHKYGKTFLASVREVYGVNSLLLRLKQKYVLAVTTGNQPTMIQKIIDQFSIPPVFSQILTSHDANLPPEKAKPHSYMLELIMKKHKVSPTETIFVGDAESDVQMARSAGVEPVVVLTGSLTRPEAEQLGVQYILPDVTSLESVLSLKLFK